MVPLPPDRGVEVPEVVLGLEIGEGDILPLVCWGDLDFNRGLPHGETGHDMLLRTWISLQVIRIRGQKCSQINRSNMQ